MIISSETVVFSTVGLWAGYVELFWFCERVSKPYVGEPRFFELHKQGHVVEVWTEKSTLSLDA